MKYLVRALVYCLSFYFAFWLNFGIIQPILIPDICMFHFGIEEPWYINVFYTFHSGHPEPNALNLLLTLSASILLGLIAVKVIEKKNLSKSNIQELESAR